MELHPGGLEVEAQLFDLRGCIDLYRARQQMLPLTDIADENWLAYEPQGKPRIVSLDRSVERWIAIGEMHDKPEFGREEIARCLDVRDEQLGHCCAEERVGRGLLNLSGHGLGSYLERLPSFKPQSARYKLLCVAELETCVQHLMVIEVPKPRQCSSNLGGDWMIPFTMPAQILLGLLLEVVEVRHRRSYGFHIVGGHCPFGVAPMRPTAALELCLLG